MLLAAKFEYFCITYAENMRASSYCTIGCRFMFDQSANASRTSSTRTRRRAVPVSGVRCASTNGASADVCTEQQIMTINGAGDDVHTEQIMTINEAADDVHTEQTLTVNRAADDVSTEQQISNICKGVSVVLLLLSFTIKYSRMCTLFTILRYLT